MTCFVARNSIAMPGRCSLSYIYIFEFPTWAQEETRERRRRMKAEVVILQRNFLQLFRRQIECHRTPVLPPLPLPPPFLAVWQANPTHKAPGVQTYTIWVTYKNRKDDVAMHYPPRKAGAGTLLETRGIVTVKSECVISAGRRRRRSMQERKERKCIESWVFCTV